MGRGLQRLRNTRRLRYKSRILVSLRVLPGETSPGLTVNVSFTANSKKSITKTNAFYLMGEGAKGRRGEGAKGRRGEGAKGRRGEGAKGRRGEGAKGRRGEGARERGSEGARERGSEGARERGREGARERRSEGANTGCGKYRVSLEVEFLLFQIAMKINWCEIGFSIMKAS